MSGVNPRRVPRLQGARDRGFPLEATPRRLLSHHSRVHGFQRHAAIERGVRRRVHHAHATHAENRVDGIPAGNGV
jgi:hypothetical protein